MFVRFLLVRFLLFMTDTSAPYLPYFALPECSASFLANCLEASMHIHHDIDAPLANALKSLADIICTTQSEVQKLNSRSCAREHQWFRVLFASFNPTPRHGMAWCA